MSVRAILRLGASLGGGLALAYGLIFIAFAVVRYGLDLRAAPPEGSLWLMVGGGVLSLAVASLGITAVMAIVAAVLGIVTALCAAFLYWLVKQSGVCVHPPAIGVGIAILFVLILHTALGQLGLWDWSGLLDTTYLFWLGIPTLIYVLAALVAGRAYPVKVTEQMSA